MSNNSGNPVNLFATFEEAVEYLAAKRKAADVAAGSEHRAAHQSGPTSPQSSHKVQPGEEIVATIFGIPRTLEELEMIAAWEREGRLRGGGQASPGGKRGSPRWHFHPIRLFEAGWHKVAKLV
jgi:hypothetical protein